ncbi:MAG: winged helix-turn-helix transcriptional regulator [Chitinispirillaceae bacterium]|nr:winged helix-turn-helix transcriptional regulator [Chitinispirillaceae bacterium]
MDNFLAITKALSDANRVRALMALRGGELCVCQIIELLGLAPSTVSKHMAVLKQAGLVKCRKEERWMYYRLPESSEQPALIRSAIDWTISLLGNDTAIIKDARSLRGIVSQDPSILCKLRRSK